ncbi:hypothetical protein MUK71_02420 [Arthrobacter zhangbolii]|uniref:Uncharacterized protein n=1 Tax=Arthrobacter zhangbolii TaxID=2886936 RepID=A0A9X1MAT6_9MICC|nr:hypothetical protein [Arthrobacter zhangbolii]MCC3273727.1 hypothetical protein [Arthrobacter zhangbolii]UON92529.1 hypothetical protein MUK71_02420 [Arthrobacter zhangbolii]
MEPRRFQLEGPSLDALKAKVLAEHGPRARIIAAEKVTVGGIGGFLSRHHYEVTVELPPSGRRRAPVEPDLPSRASAARAGISALLEEAERAESTLHPAAPAAPAGPAAPAVSTGSFAFAELIDNISASTGTPAAQAPPAPAAPGVAKADAARLYPPPLNQGRINQGLEPERRAIPQAPAPLGNAGDLVMVVGLGDEPLEVCRSMAELAGSGAAAVRVAGALETEGVGRAADRRAVATARAAGVMAGHSIYLAYGLGRSGTEMGRHATLIAALAADQVWVAVDAGRKPEDTAAWVGAVRNAVPVDAAAVEGIDTTGTPQSVNALNLPIGWLDGEPSPSPVL